jgi:hypothetical protein
MSVGMADRPRVAGGRTAWLLLALAHGCSSGQSVWDLTATAPATSADCLKDNSPPCACDRDAEAVPFFARAQPSELPSRLGSAPHPAATLDFPVAHYRDSASPRRPCAQFALEISGAAGGIIALNATARRIGDASAGVDVFAHLYSVRDPEAELATLKRAFGPMLREVVFERWGAPIEEHIARCSPSLCIYLSATLTYVCPQTCTYICLTLYLSPPDSLPNWRQPPTQSAQSGSQPDRAALLLG